MILKTTILLLVMTALNSVNAAGDPIAHIESELKAGKKTIVVSPGVYRLTSTWSYGT